MTWRPENTALTESEPTFDAKIFHSKTCGTYVKMSLELAQDSSNAEEVLKRQLVDVLALEIDRVALSGLGAAQEPMGISEDPDVLTTASVGALNGYDEFSQAVCDGAAGAGGELPFVPGGDVNDEQLAVANAGDGLAVGRKAGIERIPRVAVQLGHVAVGPVDHE